MKLVCYSTTRAGDIIRQLAHENDVPVQAVEMAASIKFPALVRHNQYIPTRYLPAFYEAVGEAISRVRRSA